MSKVKSAGFSLSFVAVTVALCASGKVFAASGSDLNMQPKGALPGSGIADKASVVRYQSSESVSGTVYQSQSVAPVAKRNIELVKPSEDALVLSESVSHETISEQQEVIVVQRASSASAPLTSSGFSFESPLPATESVAPENDVSMLAFIDEWLGIEPVKPWEKGKLAKKEMKPGGVVPEFDVFSEKVFSYKQGSVGGSGVGGGGCGCN